MEISPLLLSLLLLWSAVFGAVLCMINDVNRIIRVFLGVRYTQNGFERLYKYPLPILKKTLGELKTLPKRGFVSVIIFLQDLLFFIIAGVGVAILNYEFNEGKFRIFTLLAILVGFLLYYFTIGKLVILASELIVFSIKAIFLMIFTLVLRPFSFLGVFFAKKVKKIALFLNMAIANIRKKLYNNYRKKKLLKKAVFGFLRSEK